MCLKLIGQDIEQEKSEITTDAPGVCSDNMQFIYLLSGRKGLAYDD